jgi:hypothetical protein
MPRRRHRRRQDESASPLVPRTVKPRWCSGLVPISVIVCGVVGPSSVRTDCVIKLRWYESFLARRRPPTRRAIPGALIAGRVVDKGSWYEGVASIRREIDGNPISRGLVTQYGAAVDRHEDAHVSGWVAAGSGRCFGWMWLYKSNRDENILHQRYKRGTAGAFRGAPSTGDWPKSA